MIRTTPADRYSRRERFGRSRGAGLTSAVPASTATAGSVVAGSSRGSGVTGIRSVYRLINHGRRDMSLASRSCTIRGSSMASSQSRPGWYEVSRCSVCVAVSTLQGKHGRRDRSGRAGFPVPEAARVVAGAESRSVGQVSRLGEAGRERGRVVGIAGERDGLAAFLAPPSEDLGRQWHPGIDLERLARAGQGSQYVPVLVLEVVRVVGLGAPGPVADRVVDMGQDIEGAEPGDQRGGFGQ